MEKIYLFLTPGKTDGRVHSQQGAPTTGNIIYWDFPSRRMSKRYWLVWVWSNWKSAFQCGGGGGGGRGRNSSLHLRVLRRGGRCFRQIAPLDIESPHTPFIIYFPATLSYKDILFFPISQPARICLKNRYFEEHIHWVPLIVEKTANDNVTEMGNVYLRDE